MSRIKLKFFSSDLRCECNRLSDEYDRKVEYWLAEREGVEIIDFQIKPIRENCFDTILVIKYTESNRKKLIVEKSDK